MASYPREEEQTVGVDFPFFLATKVDLLGVVDAGIDLDIDFAWSLNS